MQESLDFAGCRQQFTEDFCLKNVLADQFFLCFRHNLQTSTFLLQKWLTVIDFKHQMKTLFAHRESCLYFKGTMVVCFLHRVSFFYIIEAAYKSQTPYIMAKSFFFLTLNRKLKCSVLKLVCDLKSTNGRLWFMSLLILTNQLFSFI